MARILHFEDFLSKRELDRITDFAAKEFPAAVKLRDRRAAPTPAPKIKPIFKRGSEPPKAA